MEYRLDKYGNRLSALGYGCLRFPKNKGNIDMEKTREQILYAIDQGINYFDTAYIYGGSEAALGQILEEAGVRDRVNIATKLPHYLIKSRPGLERMFAEQLKRLRTDRVEYYLMHMLNDVQTWERLKQMGILDWIREKREAGQIGQIGFSYHGNSDMFCRLIDAFDWDFCQIQYNYLDEHSQAGRKGLNYAHAKGIPVIIMEPLRGGKLVDKLPEEAKKAFASYPAERTPAQWGLRWLWDQKEVTVVLSGMNSMEMIRQNLQAACETAIGDVTQQEREVYRRAVDAIHATTAVGCTGCGYCSDCPKGVDIPGIFAIYNRWYAEDKSGARKEYLKCTTLRKNPTAASQCIGCGKCEKHCPQSIPIREKLQQSRKALEGPVYKVCSAAVRWFAHF